MLAVCSHRTMKAFIASDLHLEFSVPDLPAARHADLIILAGDIHVGSRAIPWIDRLSGGRPVLYVPGNHEFYHGEYHQVLRDLRAAAARHRHIHILDQDSVTLGDVEFHGATLWTDFALYARDADGLEVAKAAASARMPDFSGTIRLTQGGVTSALRPEDSIHLHHAARAWLSEVLERPRARKRVVITHHLPAEASVAARFKDDSLSPAFASRLETLVERADLWIHGHTHDCMDYQLGNCRVLCNPRGYVLPDREPENPAFAPELVVEL